MNKLTQTHEDNCWQTCVAMLLNCPPESLPDQHALHLGLGYVDPLRAYLHKHTSLTYVEVGPERFDEIARSGAAHIMAGETVRTSPNHDAWHAIVGVGGRPFWDVHPSRAGLTTVEKYGFVMPIPKDWKERWEARQKSGDKAAFCVCSRCTVA